MCDWRGFRDLILVFFFSSRRRHTRYIGDWSSDVCSSDLHERAFVHPAREGDEDADRRVKELEVSQHLL